MDIRDVSESEEGKAVRESIGKGPEKVLYLNSKVSKEHVKRLYKLVRNSYRRIPAVLDVDAGDYDTMMTLLSICDFSKCDNELDSIRTFYEALHPTLKKMYEEIQKFQHQITLQRRDMVPLIEALGEHKLWKVENVAGNLELAAKIIKENGGKYAIESTEQ